MEFRIDQDALDLKQGARDYFSGENTSERLREIGQGGDCLKLWPGLGQMGFLGAGLPEKVGGLGLQMPTILLLCEEAGRAALPEPYAEAAAVTLPALYRIGVPTEEYCSGSKRIALVHPANPFSNHAKSADGVLIVSRDAVRLVQMKEYVVRARDSIDPGRRLGLVEPSNGKVIVQGEIAESLCDEIADRGAAAAAAELCGLAERMISLATEYSKTREQFGQPIGAFQAVKHLMADAQVKLEFARPVVYRAGELIDRADPEPRRLAVAHAKVAATDAAMFAAENAIQVFGGMGYTFEVDLHFFMKRAWALAGIWGDRNHHVKHIEHVVLDKGFASGPGQTFAIRRTEKSHA